AIERAILLCDGGLITREHLPTPPRRSPAPNGNGVDTLALPVDGIDLAAVERGFLERALGQAKGNKTKAARLLGLSRAQLYSRLEKYGVQ
ncbi:MAG TPA: helix-turn-helix domain-containing protein, partial [Candidatus Eisenbacteria bacterium]|nr:helix-turn-helix domain-containing protein [Candidatus Eisenbacteria bacterium]